MEIGSSLVFASALIRILIIVLYMAVGLFAYLRIMPLLAKTPRRLASLTLCAQVLIIAVSLLIQPSSSFEDWLWRLDWKYNIPNTFASTQLALVGAVAIVTAAHEKRRRSPYRVYLTGIGVFFLVLARDEYFDLHETSPIFDMAYLVVGATIAAATFGFARRSARREIAWRMWLLAGMALYAFAAFLMDKLIPRCVRLDALGMDGCLRFAYLEESMEILGVWLILVAVLGHFSKLSPAPAIHVRRALFGLPAVWFLALALMGGIRPVSLQTQAQPASVAFDSGEYLHAHRIGGGSDSIHVHLYLTPRSWTHDGLGYSIHLVDQVTGDSIASSDSVANLRLDFLLAPAYKPVFREWTSIEIASDAPRNRALWIVLSLWRDRNGAYAKHKILTSGLKTLSDTQVVLDEIALPAESAAASSSSLAFFGTGFALESMEMPERATVGDTLDITFVWRSEIDASENFVQFLHFSSQERGDWWGHDQGPLGARLPTRLWYSGLADSETWKVPLPADLPAGQYTLSTGLYRSVDNERLPASAANGSPLEDNRLTLGVLTIEYTGDGT